MAMGGFDKEDFQAPIAEINTTPLVDVMLVLLVIFLVTAPMLTQAIKLELPNETAKEIRDQKTISISIDASGQYFWDNNPISDESLESKLQAIASYNPKQQILLHADKNVSYGKVSHLLATAQKSGLTNLGFVTEPK